MKYKKPLIKLILSFTLFMILTAPNLFAQTERLMPQWWYGGSLGANFNFYNSDIKNLNAEVTSPIAFTKGYDVCIPFFALMLEYRPDERWGGNLALGYDNRSGKFDDVTDGTTKYKLSTSMNYFTLEPSACYYPSGSGLHLFLGPRVGFNIAKKFEFDSAGTKKEQEWDKIRGVVFGLQIGAGYDFRLSSADADWLVYLSPFISAHLGQGPRSIEKWNLTTLRAGVNIKLGSTSEVKKILEQEIQFSVQAPRIIPIERKVKETFPLRNYIFFDEYSTEIPSRYIQLSREQASQFREEQLLQPQPKDLTGRSRRQLAVYYNTLNIFGDRMRRIPNATITLTGSSDRGASEGKVLAEAIKNYLVNVFNIDPVRIRTEGREKPVIPSFQPGGTRELELVKPEDRRVEINSTNLEILEPVQIISLQEDPLDSDVLFNVAGAEEILASWTVELTDEKGIVKTYGPFTANQERIPGKTILGERSQGKFTATLIGQTKSGQTVRKEESIRLVKADKPEEDMGLRFSILFEFDQSKTVATYEKFLTESVAPLIPEGGSVIIHGHTDIVGEESHNLKLSRDRANEAMRVLERALSSAGKKRVKFDTYGFGEDIRRAPFENRLPEERFYNRTVVIDIVPE